MAPDEAAVNETSVENVFADQDDDTLLRLWDWNQLELAAAQRQYQRAIQLIEDELHERLKERGATVIDNPNFECSLSVTISYDQSLLLPLKEIVDAKTLKENGWTPAHDQLVQVPEKFNLTQIKKLVKLGDEVRKIIESAQVTGPSRLVIKVKKKKETI